MTEIMIDIETLGLVPSSLVLSVAAVKFEGEKLIDSKVWILKRSEQVKAGRTIDPETVMFWLRQEKAASDHFVGGTEIPLNTFYADFHFFLNSLNPPMIWANSPQFDIVVLESLFKSMDAPIPWSYKQLRDMRTLEGLMPPDFKRVDFGTEHDPLSDAMSQYLTLVQIRKRIQFNPPLSAVATVVDTIADAPIIP